MNLQQQLGEWYPLLSHVFSTEWMQKLGKRIGAAENVQPRLDLLFRAFQLCPPDRVKVVIVGCDPYINGEADGLAFSSYGKLTLSLEVIFEEINRTHLQKRTQTHLDDWAVQGVFLLNSVLTTEMGKSRAHADWGWELFIQEVLKVIRRLFQSVVFMTWGKDAQTLCKPMPLASISDYDRLYLKACHPQAQNYNPANKFVGCNHFNEANLFLAKHSISPIWWSDPEDLTPERYQQLVYKIFSTYKTSDDVEANLIKILHSYPAIPDQPHPFDDGLESRHAKDLPF